MPSEFFFNLKALGFQVQLQDRKETILASKIRVAMTSKLALQEMYRDIGLSVVRFCDRHDEDHPHYAWHRNSFVCNVMMESTKFQQSGG